MADFEQHLTRLRTSLATREHSQILVDDIPPEKLGPPFPDYNLTPGTREAMALFRRIVEDDVHRYHPPKNTASAGQAAAEKTVQTSLEEALRSDAPAATPPPTDEDTPENGDDASQQSVSALRATTQSQFVESFLKRFKFDPIDAYPAAKATDQALLASLEHSHRQLYKVFLRETDYMSDNVASQGFAISSLQKLKKATQAIGAGRFQDAQTLLKTARGDDPNNRVLSFVFSQLMFYRAHHGRSELVPDAYAAAKSSCVFGENFDPAKLLTYRYTAAAATMHFSPRRALDFMRDYYLLSPESLTSPEGLSIHGSIHLKSWVLLSMIPESEWGEFETQSLTDLATKSVGGTVLYMGFLRPAVSRQLSARNPDFEALLTLETQLHKSFLRHEAIARAAREHFTIDGKVKKQLRHLWTLRHHYLELFLTIAPMPAFDEALMHISLDGHRYESDAYPARRAALSELDPAPYWRCWALSITYDDDIHNPQLIPIHKVVRMTAMLEEFDQLLDEMKQWENQYIDSDSWDKVQPYFPPVSPQLLARISIEQNGRLFKKPPEPHFVPFFNKWGMSTQSATLPSDIIQQHADAGGFWNLQEIHNAFEAAFVLLKDPSHGLKARMREAVRQARQQHGRDKIQQTGTSQGVEHLTEYWWLYFLLIPFSIITFFVVLSASDYGEALMLLGMIFILLLGVAGIMYFIISTSPGKPDDNEDSDDGEPKP